MHEYPYSTWSVPGARERQSLCRSPGIEPAAHTTTSGSPAAAYTAPITSPWLGSGWLPRVIEALHLPLPPVALGGDRRPVFVAHPVPVQRLGQRLEALPGVADQPQPAELARIESGDVEADEATSGSRNAE
jgi:hypothetical protein